jgi:hypothetical protein
MNAMKSSRAMLLLATMFCATACPPPPCCPLLEDREREYPFFTAEPQWICPGGAATLKYGVGYTKDNKPCDPEQSVMQVENKTENATLPNAFHRHSEGIFASNPPPPPLAGSSAQLNQDSTLQLRAKGEEKCPSELTLVANQQVVDPGDSHLLCCDVSAELTPDQTALAECSTNIFGPGVQVDRVVNESGPANPNP